MQDTEDAYGYDRHMLEAIAGVPLPAKVNTGLIGLHSPSVDVDRLEFFARGILSTARANHFIEQAMTAMLLASCRFTYAPPDAYFTPPTAGVSRKALGVFHHYAGAARRWYYQYAWRHVLARTNTALVS
jgi:hypothetical protein